MIRRGEAEVAVAEADQAIDDGLGRLTPIEYEAILTTQVALAA